MPPILFKLDEGRLGPQKLGVGPSLRGFQPKPATYLRIFGVTKDSTGAVLGSCTVTLFRTTDDLEIDKTISDASGNYEFRGAGGGTNYYVVAYKAGSPDVAGTTVNTLVGT